MQYIDFRSLLYSDTLVPDIFINEYLPALKSDYVKIYLYCLFLAGKNRNPSVFDLARILDMPEETVKKGLSFMNNLNIISWSEDGVVIKDLKEIEINKFYRPKTTSTPEEASESGKLHVRRRQVIEAINDTFFSGVMSPTWYGDIDLWFYQYGFEEDVMLLLFHHCRDNGALTKQYIAKVAENMHIKGVVNSFDFEQYLREYEELKSVGRLVQKKLSLPRRLNEYQEEYVDKWINKLGYSFDIIELALRKTINKPDAAFNYFDKILSNWHKAGYDTPEKIIAGDKFFAEEYAAEKRRNRTQRGAAGSPGRVGNIGGYAQREYDADMLEQFISSEFGDADGADGSAGSTESSAADGVANTVGNAEGSTGSAESSSADSDANAADAVGSQKNASDPADKK